MDFKKILGKVTDKIEEVSEDWKESRDESRKRRDVENEEKKEFGNNVNALLDKFEIPDFDKFLMKYLNDKPEPSYEMDKDSGREIKKRPVRRDYLDFTWKALDNGDVNYNHMKDFALKEKIVTPSFFGDESDMGNEKDDFQMIINTITAGFKPETITDEEHLESQMMVFLKAKFPARKIIRQITIQGNDRLDILVDDKYAFELKVPRARSDLRNLGAQLSEYKEKYPNVCAVIYSVDDLNLSQDIIDYIDKYKKDYGIPSLILGGKKRG